MNQNEVTLMGWYGGDRTHSLSAWTSTFEEIEVSIPDAVEDRVDMLFEYMKKFKKRESIKTS